MASDKARVSYNEKQRYTSVVMQQGRVTLDADWNEAQDISREEMRKEALDFVGPTGTPDDGYRISVPSAVLNPFDFQISPGTIYVGGLRLQLDSPSAKSAPISYSHQPDWLFPVAPQPAVPVHEFVYLALHEQEISAVEDASLREVALGGPDTAQRTRLLQRIRRNSVKAPNCSSALAEQAKVWKAHGQDFDPATMRLNSQSSLKVSFEDSNLQPNPCEPAALGGYLSAENQLIRIQITAANKFIWAFENASSFYRIAEIGADKKTVKLQSRPVDDFHLPRADQIVQALRATTRLSDGEYVAELSGHVSALNSAYKSDDQTVVLKIALPAEYQPPAGTPRLFLRIWEQELTFTPGKPVTLGETGVQVTLKTPAGKNLHLGDFWTFAVRPSTPTQVYPERYLTAFQPPEGPRVWACPLAVIDWQSGHTAMITDCREHFDDLVELSKRKQSAGCCTVIVKPETVKQKGLQAILDNRVKGEHVTVCLMPGTYELTEPIRLQKEHSNLTVEGCRRGVILQAAKGAEAKFVDGLIVLDRTANLTLKGLQLELPITPIAGQKFAGLEEKQLKELEKTFGGDLGVSIGVRTIHSSRLKIEDCRFDYSPLNAKRKAANVLAIGVFAGGQCTGLRVWRNSFIKPAAQANLKASKDIALGYVLAPSLQINAASGDLVKNSTSSLMPSQLDDAVFQENEFSGLTLASLIWSETGKIQINRNRVAASYAGFWVLSQRWLNARNITSLLALEEEVGKAVTQMSDEAKTTQPAEAQIAMQILLQLLLDTKLLLAGLAVLAYPLPSSFAHAEGDIVLRPGTGTVSEQPELTGVFGQVANAQLYEAPLTHFGMELPEATLQPTFASGAFARLKTNLAATLNTLVTEVNVLIDAVAGLASVQPALQLSLDFSDNNVEAIAEDGSSSNALLIWDTDQRTNSMLTMGGNCLSNNSLKLPTAAVLMLDRAAVTSNLIMNEQVLGKTAFWSMLLVPGTPPDTSGKNRNPTVPLITIVGNAFKGWPLLPPRFPTTAVPAPMNAWNFLNSQSW